MNLQSFHRSSALLPVLLALGPAIALAGSPIDRSVAVDPNARISIANQKGRIEVEAWDRSEVHIGGELGKGIEKFDVDGGGDHLDIRVEYPEEHGLWFGGSKSEDSVLIVQVPRGARLDAQGVSADVTVKGLDTRSFQIETVSGDLVVDARAEEGSLQTVSGDQTLRIDGPDLKVGSVSGDVELRGQANGRLHVETVSGDLDLAAGELNDVELSSVSGDIALKLELADHGHLSAETVSGDLGLHFGKALSAEVEAETFSGDISSPVGEVKKNGYGNGRSLRTRMGSGSGKLHLETFSGDIEIKTD